VDLKDGIDGRLAQPGILGIIGNAPNGREPEAWSKGGGRAHEECIKGADLKAVELADNRAEHEFALGARGWSRIVSTKAGTFFGLQDGLGEPCQDTTNDLACGGACESGREDARSNIQLPGHHTIAHLGKIVGRKPVRFTGAGRGHDDHVWGQSSSSTSLLAV
jgi:hypothetical protein